MICKMVTGLAHPKWCFFAPKRAFLGFVKHIFTIAKAYIYADYCIYFHSSSSIWWVKTRFFVSQSVSFKHRNLWFKNFHGIFLSDYFVSCQMCLNFLLFVWEYGNKVLSLYTKPKMNDHEENTYFRCVDDGDDDLSSKCARCTNY